nr:PRC-barrel domain containing protein [Micromonospora sp. DSM 115978]
MDRLDPQTNPDQNPTPLHGGQGAVAGVPPTGASDPPNGAFDPWRYRDDAGVDGANLTGYRVEATDGQIGKIDSTSHEVDSSHLVVDTGPWIFGKKVMIPAGVVNHVDHDEEKVYVDRNKDQIKDAPEFDETGHADPAYRDKLGGYYGETYGLPGLGVPPGRLM